MNDKVKFWLVSGAFGGLLFTINLALGAGLTYIFGQPGLSGIITGITTSFVFYILYRLTKKFGAITIAFLVYAILAIPTVLLGAPGIYKIIVGLLSGLAFDLILRIFKYKFFAFIVGFIGFVLVMIPTTLYSYIYLALPNLEKFKEAIWILALIFIVEGVIAAFGARLYFNKRLKNNPAVRNLNMTNESK